MLKTENLLVAYGGVQPVLHEICLHVEKGKIVSLLGANGAGKSTTLKAISGLVKPEGGKIFFEGQEIQGQNANVMAKKGISLVPEGREVFPGLTVEENLKMGAYTNYKKDFVEKGIANAYELFPRLKERYKQLAGTMSGGEQQMLAISRALMSEPKLLMLDEPSLGLAPTIVDGIFDQIKQINKNGVTILLVEQNANLALSVADYAYVLNLGTIVLEGQAADMKEQSDLMNSYLGGKNE
ncbi:MAG: ABC transporter ATP-binding protein [Anaerolineaceae bacterium]|jgi:branched-chain amino acid transport system ATP-binding protein